jgi:alkanesulfonate monooxygenase SsuD/methylene tetrahydromethanopterin reductase-like flavin-dependent oxidoreductase (luciferase family)
MGLPFKVGVTSWKFESGLDASTLCRQAETAEAMGFHSFWLPENHFGDHRTMPSPLTLLAAVSARTSRIKLGTVSYLIPIRHPLQAAEEVAVLDQLSNGRVILGVGRGIQDTVFRAFDLPVKDKRKRFRENLDIMCRAWLGEPILDMDGTDDEPVLLSPLPVQKPHPPIWVAAFGPLALKQVASLGLPYLASPIETLKSLEGNYGDYHRLINEAAFDPVTTIPVMRSIFVTDNDTLAAQVKASLARFVPGVIREKSVAVDDWTIVGDPHYVRDKLAEYVERLGVSHLIASGRLPGVDSEDVVRSHELLLACTS